MSQKGLKSDAADPPIGKDVHRLYSMRFCPFSQRVEAMFGHKGIPLEIVNIDLMSKPAWMANKNPNLEVPILQKGNAIVYESRAIMEFIEEVSPAKPTLPKDPLERAHHRMLMDACSKLYLGYFAMMQAKGEPAAIQAAVQAMQKALDFYEKKITQLGTPYFSGKEIGMVDFTIFPWFERFPVYLNLPMKLDIMPAAKYPKLTEWFARIQTSDGIKAASQTLENHIGFVKGIMFDKKFNYDFGL